MTERCATGHAEGTRNFGSRDLGRTVLGFALASGLPALANLLALVVFSRTLGPAQFGVYALNLAAATLVQALIFGCWRHALIRHFHDARSSGSDGDLLAAVLTGGIISALLVILLWTCLAPHPIEPAGLAACLGLGLLDISLALHIGDLAPYRYGGQAGVRALGGLVLGTAGMAVFGHRASVPLLAVGLAAAMGALVDWPVWRSAWRRRSEANLRYSLRALVKFGLPIACVTAMGAGLPLIDRALLAGLVDLREAGLFAPAQDLTQQSLGFLFAVINLGAYPLALRAYRSEGAAGAAAKNAENLIASAALLLPSAVGLILIAGPLARLLFAPEFSAAVAVIIPWLAAATFIQGIRAFVVDMIFQITERTLRQTWGMATVLLSGLLFDIVLIPRAGAEGAAVSALLAQLAGLAVSLGLARSLLPWRWPWRDLLRIGLATACMAPAVWSIRTYGPIAQTAAGILVYGGVLSLLMPQIRRLPWRAPHKGPHIAG